MSEEYLCKGISKGRNSSKNLKILFHKRISVNEDNLEHNKKFHFLYYGRGRVL